MGDRHYPNRCLRWLKFMNTLTHTDISNAALRKSRNGKIENFNSDKTDLAQDCRLYFKKSYQKLISSYPWPFATHRMELQKDTSRTPVRSFSNFFLIPQDAMFIWQVYNDGDNYTPFGSIWNYRNYEYFSFEDSSDGSFFSTVGELIGDSIASSFSQLFILYTRKKEIPIHKWSVPFAETMIAEMTMLLEESTTQDTEMLNLKIRSNTYDKKQMKTVSAIQNRKAATTERAQILNTIDEFRWR